MKYALMYWIIYHDELDGRADEAVLDGAGEQERGGVLQQPAHDVLLPCAQAGQVAQVEQLGRDFRCHQFSLKRKQ